MGNGAKAQQKRERNAKDGKKDPQSQLKSVRPFPLPVGLCLFLHSAVGGWRLPVSVVSLSLPG